MKRFTGIFLAGLAISAFAAEPAAAQRTTGSAWGIETAGGAVGSIAGFGIGVLSQRDRCESEDLECYLDAVGVVLLSASAGSTLGTWLIGKAAHTDPSLVGAALGSLVGAAGGVAVLKLLDEVSADADEGVSGTIAFSVSQGALTALGSRIGAALR